MSNVGKMYKVRQTFGDDPNDDYILMDELSNVVCLMNNRTNNLHWVSRHMLKLEYIEKK